MSDEPQYMVEPGHHIGRAAYIKYLRRCATSWLQLGHPKEALRVDAKANQIALGEDDISLRWAETHG